VCIEIVNHPLLRGDSLVARMTAVEAITQGDPAPIELARNYLAAQIDQMREEGRIPPGDSRRQVDVLIHLVLGYLAAPATTIDLGNTEEVRALARETFAPILLT
ncbi:TetR/AcrR family transcriptional regulator, partial [Mycobacteroides abscessus subsp. massiliense]